MVVNQTHNVSGDGHWLHITTTTTSTYVYVYDHTKEHDPITIYYSQEPKCPPIICVLHAIQKIKDKRTLGL